MEAVLHLLQRKGLVGLRSKERRYINFSASSVSSITAISTIYRWPVSTITVSSISTIYRWPVFTIYSPPNKCPADNAMTVKIKSTVRDNTLPLPHFLLFQQDLYHPSQYLIPLGQAITELCEGKNLEMLEL